jgi:hypothetical protein
MNIRCDEPLDEGLVTWLGDQRSAQRQLNEFKTGRQQRWVEAVNRQHALAKVNEAGERAISGMGQHVAQIDGTLYWELFGETAGESLRDPETFQKLLRDNPMFRVRYLPKVIYQIPGVPWHNPTSKEVADEPLILEAAA